MSALEARLADAEREHREASETFERKREARNEVVGEALAAGWSHAEIASATGISRARVGQISLSLRNLA